MKTRLPLALFLALSLLTACDKQVSQEEIYLEELANIEEQLADIGMFAKQATADEATVVTAEKVDSTEIFDLIGDDMGRYIVKTMESQLTGSKAVYKIPAKTDAAVWPGNLIQGKSIFDGNLAPVPLNAAKRKPGTIYLNVVSGSKEKIYREVDNFSAVDVTQAMNDILAEYKNGFHANVSYMQKKVSSVEQMAYQLDMGKEEFMEKSGGVFSGIEWNSTKTRIMVKLEQSYFTMAYEFPGINEVFKNDVRWSDLQPYTSKDNPICYISSVDYGRYYVLLYESEKSSEKILSEAIARAYDKTINKEQIKPTDRQVFEHTTVNLFMVGGNAEEGLKTITGDPEAIKDFVLKGATVSKENVGAPIRYSLRYLYNSTEVPVYRDIDVMFKDFEFINAIKENDVEIAIKSIHSAALSPVAGCEVLPESYYSVSNILVEVFHGNGRPYISPEPLNPQLSTVNSVSTSSKYYTHTFKLGKLGENTDKKIVLTFTVNYRTRLYVREHDSNSTDDQDIIRYPAINNSYVKRIEFLFDKDRGRWFVSHSDSPQNRNFQSVNIQDRNDFFGLDFSLYYSFKSDGETYFN